MKQFVHGGNVYSIARKLNISVSELIDFSANINPLGPPDFIKQVIYESIDEIVNYPDIGLESLIKAASMHYGVAEEEIVFANGSTEILYHIPRILDLKNAVIFVPSYVDYEKVCKINKIDIDFIPLNEEDSFLITSVDQVKNYLKKDSIVFWGQPNNPTGKIVNSDLIRDLASNYPNSFFVVDEAFSDFVDDMDHLYFNRPQNVIVLLSLTKFYAIPGIRLGLAIADKKIIKKLKSIIPPWSVNVIAQNIGSKIFQDVNYRYKTVEYIKSQRNKLVEKLRDIKDIRVYDSYANFLLIKILTDKWDVDYLKNELLKKRILIRDCSNYRGLNKKFFRLAVKKEDENNYLVQCLNEIINGEKNKVKTFRKRVQTSVNTPAIMFVGTSSNAGKSILAAGLCRILLQEGYKVAPFKAQNMSLNSYVTKDGGEMGRAQVLQAQACRLDPDVRMNPVLLKPSSDTGSQVIVLGKPVGNMDVLTYYDFKKDLISTVRQAYDSLASEYDVMVLEGAGSPAEINLKEGDITNMEMASYARASTLIVGDIDRGGVFASFFGTYYVLDKWEREFVKGFVINKFRGDATLLDSAISFMHKSTGKSVLGIVPYIKDLRLPEEDSVSFKFGWDKLKNNTNCEIKIACIDLPHISNFTDIDPFLIEPDVYVKIIKNNDDLIDEEFDVIIIPGSKNVINDNRYLIKSSIADTIKDIALNQKAYVIGICGGFQILGRIISDPYHLESNETSIQGLGLLPIVTVLEKQKTLIQTNATFLPNDMQIKGYEIHHGKTELLDNKTCVPVVVNTKRDIIGYGTKDLKIWGSYLHGIFDDDNFRRFFIDLLREEKGLKPLKNIQARYDVEEGLNRLADVMRKSVDIEKILSFIEKR